MDRIKVLIDIPSFLKNYTDFVLIDALNVINYNFKEVVQMLKIEDEVEDFFGKSLEKYTVIDQFERIIEDILSGTKPEHYESLLIKMHQNFLFPDHIMILNQEHIPEKEFTKLTLLLKDEVMINTGFRSDSGKFDEKKYKHISGIIQDFCNRNKGVYCFILLHRSDFSIVEKDKILEIFNTSLKGTLKK
jgi:hypothetical protein